jgi:hypothetical protein
MRLFLSLKKSSRSFSVSKSASARRNYHSPFKMLFPSIILLALVTSVSVLQATTLTEALNNSGASQYATLLESTRNISNFNSSDQGQTIFAPIDGRVMPSLRNEKRVLSPAEARQVSYQSMKRTNTLGSMSVPPGSILQSNDNSGNLNGQSQHAVSDPSTRTQSTAAKRWLSPRQSSDNANTTNPSPLKIFTGLGHSVNILKADIPYDSGLIHIISE